MTADLLPDLAPALVDTLDETIYHADQRALSQSAAKVILRSPAHFRWQQQHPPEPKTRFEFGTAAHKLVLKVGAPLVEYDYDAEKVKKPKATTAFKEQQAALRKTGGVLLLPDEMRQVEAMAAKIREHRLAMELLAEGQAEVSAYGQDPDTGIWLRGRFDWLAARTVVDYKTAESSDPVVFVKKAVEYAYDLQSAWYLDLAALAGHPVDAFAHIVQEDKPPYVVTVVVLPAELIMRGRALKRRALERYRDCIEADAWPGYLPDTEFATPPAPMWALQQVADEIEL